jgi:hypothetical protein
MTECRVIIALWIFAMSISWAIQSAPKAATHLENRAYQAYRAENQRQVDEVVRLDAIESIVTASRPH